MSEPLHKWESLQCGTCHSERFTPVVILKRHPIGGLHVEPVGEYVCIACHHKADTAAMMNELRLKRQRAQLAALEQELKDAESTAPTAPTPATGFDPGPRPGRR